MTRLSIPVFGRFGRALWLAVQRFGDKNGFVMSSHVAMSLMLALFPFVLFTVALAGSLSQGYVTDELIELIFGAWPQDVAQPIVAELRAKVDLNDNRARFIADVVSGRLVVFKRRRADLESDMAKSFTPKNGDFSYLLDIKTHQYTEEAIRDLMQEVDACKRELHVIMGKDERDMWLDDLREL